MPSPTGTVGLVFVVESVEMVELLFSLLQETKEKNKKQKGKNIFFILKITFNNPITNLEPELIRIGFLPERGKSHHTIFNINSQTVLRIPSTIEFNGKGIFGTVL